MSLLVEKPGLLTTVQDLGRSGWRRFGINPNGAMDRTAARLINLLLGNAETEAVLEMHFPAPDFVFEEPAFFALGGADLSARLNERRLENWRPFFARKGDRLKFEDKVFGSRSYLAVKGGFEIEKWLGSASLNLTAKMGGIEGRKLQSGDRLNFNQPANSDRMRTNYKISNSLIPFYSRFPTVRVTACAEFELLTALSQEVFLKENFVLSPASDRMGFRLAGAPLYPLHERELVSSAVDFGTIQLLPDGQLIVLMADHQTSGGYPRLANVISTDLPLLAQLGANDKVAFHLATVAEAENLLLDFEKDLNFLRVACKLQSQTG